MAVLDIIILAVTAVAAYLGYRKGFIAQIGSIAAIFTGILACRLLGHQAVELILPSDPAQVSAAKRFGAVILANACLYIAAYYAVVLAVRMLRSVTRTIFLGPLDAIGGALASILKWYMALSVAFNLYLALFPGQLQQSSRLADGALVEFIVQLAPAAWGAFTLSLTGTPAS